MSIPPRQPYGESFSGVILKIGESTLLSSTPQAGAEVLHTGTFILRYAIEYLGKPQWSIVPGLVALDYGDILTGEEAWQFLFHRSNLYPRADVIGYRNDGVDDMVPVKKLDLMQPVVVLVYADEAATTPLAQPKGIVAGNLEGLPPWLAKYGRIYKSMAEWQAETHE
jgi:hypothetical protein